MLPRTCRFLLIVLVLHCLHAGQTSSAAPVESSNGVVDAGKLFSVSARRQAQTEIARIKQRHKKDVLIETYATVPPDKAEQVKAMNPEERAKFFRTWAGERFQAERVNGVYVLVCRSPSYVQTLVGNVTIKKAFTAEDRKELTDLLLSSFRKKEFDRGLVEGVALVRDRMDRNLATAVTRAARPEEKPILVLDTGSHTADIRKILFTPDNQGLITVSVDKTVRIWNLTNRESTRVIRLPIGPGWDGQLHAAALSADGGKLAVAGIGQRQGRKVSCPIYILSLRTLQIEHVLRGHDVTIDAEQAKDWYGVSHFPIMGLSFSPDGRRLVSNNRETLCVWDVSTGNLERRFGAPSDSYRAHVPAMTPDGKLLVVQNAKGFIELVSLETGAKVGGLTPGGPPLRLEPRRAPHRGLQ